MREFEAISKESQVSRKAVSVSERSELDEMLRDGARRMLLKAIESEAVAYIEAHSNEVDEEGRRLVVRNGHAAERTLVSGAGILKVSAPRINDRRVDEDGNKFRFTSATLPPYLRRTKSIEELIPWLYLKGISTGDFSDALKALLGPASVGNHGGASQTSLARGVRELVEALTRGATLRLSVGGRHLLEHPFGRREAMFIGGYGCSGRRTQATGGGA